MASRTLTDNANLPAKLELRRYFLARYHKDTPPDVLDCCGGDGEIWGTLRDEFKLASFWAVDLKPKKGRLRMDSVQILAQPGWTQNVIDVDTYGSPFKHWMALLPRVTKPTTVFLTIGKLALPHVHLGWHELLPLGITLKGVKALSQNIITNLHQMSVKYNLALAYSFNLKMVEAVEAEHSRQSGNHVRYLGVRLEPA